MKTRTIIILVGLSMMVSSCILSSLFPLYKESDLIRDDRILGSWLAEEKENRTSVWTFEWLDTAETGKGMFGPGIWAQYARGNTYKLIAEEDSLKQVFAVHLFKLAGETFIDFYPVDFEVEHGFLAWHMVPSHIFAQIEITTENLIFKWFEPDYFAKLIEQNKVKISHIDMDGRILITAETGELQKFVQKYGDEAISHTDPDTIPRIALK